VIVLVLSGIFTSAKEDMFSSLLATLRKNFQMDLHEIFKKVGNGPLNN